VKKNTKKKLLTLALVIALLAIAVVGGSLAWFTDSDEVENVFTVGTIGIEQHEKNKDGSEFTQNQMLFPVISDENVENDPNFIYKRVSIENTGSNDAYIRTWIAIPTQLKGYLCFKTDETGWVWQWAMPTADVYDVNGTAVNYTAYCYVYSTALAANTITNELLTGVYLDPAVDIKDNPSTVGTNLEFCKWNEATQEYDFSGFEIADENGKLLDTSKVEVLVATQAVQVEGFRDAQDALNTAFGKPEDGAASVPFFN